MKIVSRNQLAAALLVMSAAGLMLVFHSADLWRKGEWPMILLIWAAVLLADTTARWRCRPLPGQEGERQMLPPADRRVLGMDGSEVTAVDLRDLEEQAAQHPDTDWQWAQQKQRGNLRLYGLLYMDRVRLMRRVLLERQRDLL